jgi:hypothetical protein
MKIDDVVKRLQISFLLLFVPISPKSYPKLPPLQKVAVVAMGVDFKSTGSVTGGYFSGSNSTVL